MKNDDSPTSLFLSLLRAPESKRQYPPRLQVFFNFLGLEGDIENQSKVFVNEFKKDNEDDRLLQKKLLSFSRSQRERVDNKEISPSTVPNYFKAIKLFCQANNLSSKVEWKLISKSLPLGFQASDDRAPTLEEIQKLLEFPDRRIKPLVLTLVSSGVRIGAFETLRWKHIVPLNDKSQEIIAAKIRVYPGEREEYYSFVTVEAYNALEDWMDYRAACGEKITKESFVMRDIWQIGDLKGITDPKPLNTFSITRLLNRAWQAQKIRPQLQKGEKRHEFKTAHGFRKYFKTQMEQARVPSIKIELLLGHSIGISDSYAEFSENEMLEDYLIGTDYLTVNQTVCKEIVTNLKRMIFCFLYSSNSYIAEGSSSVYTHTYKIISAYHFVFSCPRREYLYMIEFSTVLT
ncbi:site-specific integrase [Candidatus Nitrosocosmicus arcticus]|uniref:Putative Site-specific recombinase phage integrase family n=1 Tax=Candidatus Nitrosocosmicus arcticus TaxID=2035267 RepID=A0A557SX56_9ARCH|nr:site-specific integrase [Candidatus Nitrosocosmicus arcticus]TVP41182.1 putative Site-specific recombinase phage integrase family [Candidatus Nitrosocosmicus arcticus]